MEMSTESRVLKSMTKFSIQPLNQGPAYQTKYLYWTELVRLSKTLFRILFYIRCKRNSHRPNKGSAYRWRLNHSHRSYNQPEVARSVPKNAFEIFAILALISYPKVIFWFFKEILGLRFKYKCLKLKPW